MVRFGKIGEFKVNGESFGESRGFRQGDTAHNVQPRLKSGLISTAGVVPAFDGMRLTLETSG